MENLEKDKEATKERHLTPRQVLNAQRYTDSKTQIPLPNMAYKDTAPFISVIGPRFTGQDVLFSKLLFALTKSPLPHPDCSLITISDSKHNLTLHNCESNLNAYIDASKISDLVILTINSEYFEMDTFEIVSLLKSHGLCKIMIACTFSSKIQKKKCIGMIKKRMWKEIAGGLKVYDTDSDSDIKNMARIISGMKYRPLKWKCSNSFVVADKIVWHSNNKNDEYIKNNNIFEKKNINGKINNDNNDKNILNNDDYLVKCDFFGYVRGCPFRSRNCHIPGKGDYEIISMEEIDDPCKIVAKRELDRERKKIYAPNFINHMNDTENNDEVKEKNENKNLSDDSKITHKILAEKNRNAAKEENFHQEAENKPREKLKEKIKLLKEKLFDKFVQNNEIKETDSTNIRKNKKSTKETTIQSEKEERLAQETKNKEIDALFSPGKYVKITLKMKETRLNTLTIIGEIHNTSDILLQGKVKKTNYFSSVLKSNQEYLYSIGWRRENMVGVFSIKDTTRNRFIKYCLQNTHSNISFKSKIVMTDTPFCIIKERGFIKDENLYNEEIENDHEIKKIMVESDKHFRIAANGIITDVSGKTGMVKKLKLIGYPKKIHENTVFVKDMFGSDKEAAKFEGALIKTVSGIRGSVKKATGNNGDFRATFEGRILMSDIIFMRCYVPYEINDKIEEIDEEENINIRKNVKRNIENTHNLTEIVEDKKKRKYDEEIELLQARQCLNKRKVTDEKKVIELPNNPSRENFIKLKEKIADQRIKDAEDEKLQKINFEMRKKLQDKKMEIEKKRGLRKNIIESKHEKMMKKKSKRRIKNKKKGRK